MNNIIIGNYISRIFFAVTLILHYKIDATIQLQVTDLQSRPLNSVGLNQQFLIHFRAENISSQIEPLIPGLEKVHGKKTGVSISTINGISSAKYSYICYADQLGTITIGPTHIKIKGTIEESNTLNVVVTEQETVSHVQKKNVSEPIVELIVDQTNVYIGQKIKIKLRFLYDKEHHQKINLKKITPPTLNNMHIEQATQDATQGFTIYQQKPYQYIEWEWFLYPHDEGVFSLPPYGIDYEMDEEDEEHSFFGAFSFMFKPKNVKRTYSNTITLQVKPIPLYHNRPVDAVGDFEKIKAQLSLKNIVQQDATELTFSLYGSEADFDSLPFLALKEMPSSCRFYESQSKIENATNQQKVKHFSYIIQANESGTFIIPAQEYVTFNPRTEKHFILNTKPLKIIVTPRPIVPAKPNNTAGNEAPALHTKEPSLKDSFILTSRSRNISYQIPWILFWIMSALIIMSNIIISTAKCFYRRLKTIITYYAAYFIARKTLHYYQKNKNTRSLEALFSNLIKHRQRSAAHHPELNLIQKWFDEKEYANEIKEKWINFVKNIHMHQFAHKLISHSLHNNSNILFEQGLFWLYTLQKGGF